MLSHSPSDVSSLPSSLDVARTALSVEIAGLQLLQASFETQLADSYQEAVACLLKLQGRLVVSGLGKSGHVARKIAATLSSTGTPSFFIHPSEAGHGDLGMVTSQDAVLCLSWSGETQELSALIAYTRRFHVPLIAMTAGPNSTLAQMAEIVLCLPNAKEACPHGLAPTTSTLMQMALGDALALSLLQARGFTAEEFKIFHPGGRLGAALQRVRDLMYTGACLPCAPPTMPVTEALLLMSEKGLGCVCIQDATQKLLGIITDGDLRRHMGPRLLEGTLAEIMTPSPRTITPEATAAQALYEMNAASVTQLCVITEGRLIGILHMHTLLRAGVS